MGNNGEFAPQWSMDLTRQDSLNNDRLSISSHESQGSLNSSIQQHPNYDTPKFQAQPVQSSGETNQTII
jgi:hypothetical protein